MYNTLLFYDVHNYYYFEMPKYSTDESETKIIVLMPI